MNKIFTLLLVSFAAFSQSETNFMTFNIRYATPADGVNQWENRKQYVAQSIRFYEAAICGLQEATQPQVEYLAESLSEYKWIGVGRDDGKDRGEFSPIFYKTTEVTLIEWGTLWLSETPEKPSKGWDAALPRIATWAKFKNVKNKRVFYVVNTHYDHIGQLARKNSSALLVKKCKDLNSKGLPLILMGDFNSTPSEEPIKIILDSELKNTKVLSKEAHFGPIGTFNGFNSKEDPARLIDYIFVLGKLEVLKHAALSNTWEGRFASDHFAIWSRIKL